MNSRKENSNTSTYSNNSNKGEHQGFQSLGSSQKCWFVLFGGYIGVIIGHSGKWKLQGLWGLYRAVWVQSVEELGGCWDLASLLLVRTKPGSEALGSGLGA